MTEKKVDEVVVRWAKRYEKSLAFHQPIFERMSEFYAQFYASINAEGMANWRSKVFIPVLNEKAWQILAKVVQGKAGWHVLPKEELWAENARNQENLLKYQFVNPELDKTMLVKESECTMDAIIAGTGVGKTHWMLKEKKIYDHIVNEDGSIDYDKYKEVTTKLGYNDFEPICIYDFLPAPGAKSVQRAPWIIVKGRAIINDLKEQFSDHPDALKILDKHEGATPSDDTEEYKKSRTNYFEEFKVKDTTVEEVELWECYDRKNREIIYILNRREILFQKKDTSWHGKIPLVVFNLKPKGGSIFGEGIFEVSHRLQYAINDLFNHYMDSYNLAVDGMVMLDETSEVEDFITEPGGVFHYQGNPPIPWSSKEPNPTTFTMVQNVLRQAVDGVTISPYVTGNPNDANDKTQGTATGIIRIQEAAGDLIAYMRHMLKTAHKEIGFMWMMNNIQYIDRDQRIIIEDGIKKSPATLKPIDIQGEFELDIDVAVLEPVNKEAMRQVYLDYLQQIKDLVVLSQRTQSPMQVDFMAIAKILSEKFGIQEYDKILAGPPAVPPGINPETGQPIELENEMMHQDTPQGTLQDIPQDILQDIPQAVPQMPQMPTDFQSVPNNPNNLTPPIEQSPEKTGFLNRLLSYMQRPGRK